MPCYDPPHSYCKHGIEDKDLYLCDLVSAAQKLDRENQRVFENLKEELAFYKDRTNKITDMLCRVCLTLEVAGAIFPPDIHEWWEKHKAWDKQRKDKK